jgi:hypothetical protein
VPYAIAAATVVVIGLVAALVFVLTDSPTTSAPVAESTPPSSSATPSSSAATSSSVAGAPQQAASPTPTAAPIPTAGTGVVNSAVDIYDVPDGVGNVIGVLGRDRRVSLVEPCRDGWCHVTIPEMPGGTGWVWGEFLTF